MTYENILIKIQTWAGLLLHRRDKSICSPKQNNVLGLAATFFMWFGRGRYKLKGLHNQQPLQEAILIEVTRVVYVLCVCVVVTSSRLVINHVWLPILLTVS